MLTKPALLLRTEGLALLATSVIAYHQTHASWILFAVLLLAPDLSMIGYAAGIKLGAMTYNAVHTLTFPFLLIAYAILATRPSLLPYALIWTAHIGMDRTLAFGLKYPTQFKDTHLQHV